MRESGRSREIRCREEDAGGVGEEQEKSDESFPRDDARRAVPGQAPHLPWQVLVYSALVHRRHQALPNRTVRHRLHPRRERPARLVKVHSAADVVEDVAVVLDSPRQARQPFQPVQLPAPPTSTPAALSNPQMPRCRRGRRGGLESTCKLALPPRA